MWAKARALRDGAKGYCKNANRPAGSRRGFALTGATASEDAMGHRAGGRSGPNLVALCGQPRPGVGLDGDGGHRPVTDELLRPARRRTAGGPACPSCPRASSRRSARLRTDGASAGPTLGWVARRSGLSRWPASTAAKPRRPFPHITRQLLAASLNVARGLECS